MTWLDNLTAHAAAGLDDRTREALWERGVTDDQMVSFKLGYLDRRLPDLDYSPAFLKWADKGAKLDDVFVLPLTNTLGAIKGFQFRHVDRERAGYMDFIAEKGEAVLFGLNQAMPHIWKSRSVCLVEGAFDLFPVQRFHPATVATLTARVVDPLVRILRRLVDRVFMGYDMDVAGRASCEKFVKWHGRSSHVGAQEFDVTVVDWPQVAVDGSLIKDPADLWEAWGDTQFEKFIQSIVGRDQTMEPFNAKIVR